VPLSALLIFSSFVFFPKQLGGFYAILLAFLRTTAKQYNDSIAVSAKVNTLSGNIINTTFKNSSTEAFGISLVDLVFDRRWLRSHQRDFIDRHSRICWFIESALIFAVDSRKVK
jgi:hypothetical protein